MVVADDASAVSFFLVCATSGLCSCCFPSGLRNYVVLVLVSVFWKRSLVYLSV